MRVARGANGIAKVDHGQKRAPGRGAYLCRAVSCVELAAKRQALRRALGAEVPANIYVELMSLTAQTDIEAE